MRWSLVAIVLFSSIIHAGEKVAAIVNGEPITVAELDAALRQLPPEVTPVSTLQKRQQRAQALEALIDDKLVRQFLKQSGPKVEPAEVDRQYAALIASQRAQGKSIEEYLKENELTPAQVKESFLRILQLARFVEGRATAERLRAYFDVNRDLFDKTTVRTSHIVLRVGASATPAERQKSMDKLRSIRADLAAGKVQFADAAKAHSQCPSATSGGDMGYIVRKFQADEAYARAAFSLKIGEVSDIIESEGGLHLVWVTDRKPGKPARFEDVADDVRECFEAELKQNLVAELRKKSKIEVKLP
jgi:parvulin-like peptidyl-prolyl isomerase